MPGADSALRRTVLVVALLNLAYFGVEFIVALSIGSVSLFADSVDFLEDASVNLLIFFALAWSAKTRARVGNGAGRRSARAGARVRVVAMGEICGAGSARAVRNVGDGRGGAGWSISSAPSCWRASRPIPAASHGRRSCPPGTMRSRMSPSSPQGWSRPISGDRSGLT
jgi:hypothetical protein